MNITLQSTSVCGGGEHRSVVTDKGTFVISNSDMQNSVPDDFEAHKTAGRTQHQ